MPRQTKAKYLSRLESFFLAQIKATPSINIEPNREYKFDPTRRWRFDFAWPEAKLAVEIEGGTWGTSRHTTGKGFAADCEKYNSAVAQGWRVLRFTGDMVDSGLGLELLMQVWEGDGDVDLVVY